MTEQETPVQDDAVQDEAVRDEVVQDDAAQDDAVLSDAVRDATAPLDEGDDDGDLDEGDIAADYIEGLLDIADLDGDIEIEQTDARTTIVVGEAGDALAGLAGPDVVGALQELTRLAVQQQTGEFSRLVLDVAGSRDARAEQLQLIVDRAAASLEDGAARVPLEPMSSYERKLVHDLVRERGLASESDGEGASRHIVILPA